MEKLFRVDVFINGDWKAQDSNPFHPNPLHDFQQAFERARVTANACPSVPVRIVSIRQSTMVEFNTCIESVAA